MIHLLDVNVLLALLDPGHLHHRVVHRWVHAQPAPLAWATCPLTENAFVRIASLPAYPNSLGSTQAALDLLKRNCAAPGHHFWPDDFSLREPDRWNGTARPGPAHLTDCYLLALAVRHGGRLASLDRRIPAHLVQGGREAMVLLPG